MAPKLALPLAFAFAVCAAGDAQAQFVFAPPPGVQTPQAPQTPQIPAPTFADVLAHYQTFNTWTASFDQKYLAKAHNQTKASSGTIRSQRGMIEVTYPGGPSMVSSCAAVPSVNFLCGPQSVAKFNVQTVAGSTMNFPGGIVFVATPNAPISSAVKILLYVDLNTLEVRREMVIDAQGNRNRFEFTNVVTT